MIAFGAAITRPEPYERYAEPGIRRAAEPGSAILAFAAVGPIARTYNLILDAAAERDDLEALVLVHPHLEIADPDFCATVRRTLRDPAVGVAGCVGAAGVRSIAWWEGVVSAGRMVHRYGEHGGGDLEAYSWADPRAGAAARSTPSTARCSSCRRGRCAACASTSRCGPTTALTSTTAGRSARPGARSSPPTCAPSTTTRSR